ncbi:MAG TPA: YsnF/AvaK domain-containing protein [Rhodanobacteraceae bacterium]|nr:YsnF/AvaK domain-containing protein [Rhodanobacteraceae bacterium]
MFDARDAAQPRRDGMAKRIPLLKEELDISKRTLRTGTVRIGKQTVERQERVDPLLMREDVEVRRVPVHRAVDRPVPTRVEGDTTIISLHEEVPVVTTQLMVMEELHVSIRRTHVHAPRTVALRRELPRVERTGEDSADDATGAAAG